MKSEANLQKTRSAYTEQTYLVTNYKVNNATTAKFLPYIYTKHGLNFKEFPTQVDIEHTFLISFYDEDFS